MKVSSAAYSFLLLASTGVPAYALDSTVELNKPKTNRGLDEIANDDSSFSYTYTESQDCSREFCSSYWASEDGAICRSTDSSFNGIQYNVNDRNDCSLKIGLSRTVSCVHVSISR